MNYVEQATETIRLWNQTWERGIHEQALQNIGIIISDPDEYIRHLRFARQESTPTEDEVRLLALINTALKKLIEIVPTDS